MKWAYGTEAAEQMLQDETALHTDIKQRMEAIKQEVEHREQEQ
ncbi:hypothetical protein ACFSO7_20745 [Bacillus sp. CGMCC 1.16607]